MVGPSGRVISCEPRPGIMALLRANTLRTGFAIGDLYEVALSDSAGTAPFTIFDDGSGVASFAPQPLGGHTVEVTVSTLDSLTVESGDRVALVKLDVEGAEARALRGALAPVAQCSRFL